MNDRLPARGLDAVPGDAGPTAGIRAGGADETDYRQLVRDVPVGLLRTAPDGQVLAANPAALEMVGLPPDADFSGLRIQDFYLDPGDRSRALAQLATGRAGGVAEIRVLHTDGSTIWVELRARPIRDDSGAIAYYDGALVNVTERRRGDRRAARQRDELSALHETAVGLIERLELTDLLEAIMARAANLLDTPHGFLDLVDRATGVAEVRAGTGLFARITGFRYRPGEGLSGRAWATARAQMVTDYATWPERLPVLDGLPVHSFVVIPLLGDGRVLGLLGLAYDDPGRRFGTDEVALLERFARLASLALDNARLFDAARQELVQRRRVESTLRETEARYRSLVEQLPAVIELTALDERATPLYVSPQVEAFTGYTPEEWLADPGLWIAGLHPDDRDRVIAEHRRQLADLEPFMCEYRAFRRDGRLQWLRDEAVIVRDESGRPLYAQGVSYDITERKHLEDRLRQGEKMEAVGRLAGGIAHDFNNLLTAISGYAELLMTELPPGDARRQDAVAIATTADRAAALTRQLLTFSRQDVPQPQLVDLNRVIGSAEQLLRRLIGERIELVISLAPGLGSTMADPSQLEQIVVNLAVNARDAMPNGGVLRISTLDATLQADQAEPLGAPPGRYVAVEVADAGTGMDAETLAHLFEPFFTTKEPGQGTGLGLATVYGVVHESGGAVRVDSTLDVGTTITVYLPHVSGAQPLRSHDDHSVAPQGSGETILVVEDEPGVRTLVLQVLKRAGYACLAAPDAETALEVAKKHPAHIDLLLTDVVLPGLSGVDLVELIRVARPDTRAVCMSGYAAEHQLPETAAFLAKPFAAHELLSAVRRALVDGG